ncbi:MAG: S49 family peptidase, partial [Pseudobdellovibrionaceae bacterium]|nr:S49 family peptidase [Pseudobdellovibrionaceae bacterium]
RANLMTEHCGATSYELVLRDFHQMLAAPDVKSIVFDIDSPGGEANGCSELSDHIHAARGKKPTAAYIGGTGASAAYWIASACERVFASDSAIVGSIGVQSVLQSEKAEGEIRFVSSQSPNKNRDPGTEEGAKEVQAVIDGLAEIFVGKVARNRAVSRTEVMEKFGQGSVFVGGEAQKRGLVDDISTFEGVISHFQEHKVSTETITAEFIAAKHPGVAEHFINLGASKTLATFEAEQKRISGIKSLGEGQVADEFIAGLIARSVSVQDAAIEILLEIRKNPPKPKADKRKAFNESLRGLDIPPRESSPDTREELALQQDAAIELARKLGLTGVNAHGL